MQINRYSQTKLALGSDVELILITSDSSEVVSQLFSELWLIVFTFEKRFSRFIGTSELSKFNRRSGEWQEVSPEFMNMLLICGSMSKLTDGLFNPFILPLLQRTGYSRSFVTDYSHEKHDDYAMRRIGSPDELQLDGRRAYIPKDTALDFGGCGKGYLADLLSQHEGVKRLHGFCFSIGGDIVTGGKDQEGNNWSVVVQDASNTDAHHQTLSFALDESTCAVATSGVIEKRGYHKGRKWHHLIDPSTGLPATTDILVASVSAKNAVTADVLASCAVIMGSEDRAEYVVSRGAQGVVTQSKGRVGNLIVDTFGGGVINKKEVRI